MAIFNGAFLYMNHLRLKLLEKLILTMFLPSFPFFLHFFNWKYYLIDMRIKKQLKKCFSLNLKKLNSTHTTSLKHLYYVVFHEQGFLMKHSKKTPPPSPRLKPNCQNHNAPDSLYATSILTCLCKAF